MFAVARAVSTLFEIYEFLIIAWCILSWIPRRPGGFVDDLATVVNDLVAPYMNLFRRFIPPLGGIDFSPIVAILVLGVLQNVVVQLLFRL
ncbi:YggT family protein [Olsenella sp. YH-ols2217]|uniref:YggT family protein n=1 Tax=Kribbibacterium absianum TaxID=3044210 RepID=A0ABT6ZM01_9ACTN|nr:MULTISPECIES: YggT family protein [unclassified Olsenella]MDJ1122080.1 YggT family protein [Olsenella sp. YH-ols2216]MDJ1130088.1 YggT family protein [Olsenella sp. YH-ols2217]